MHGPLGTALRGLAPVVLLGTVVVAPAAAAPAGPPIRLEDVSLARERGAVVVTVRTSGRPRYTSTVIDGPHRVVVDFPDARYAWRAEPWAVGEPPVKEIRGSQFRRDVARLVVELTERAEVRVVPRPDGVRIVVAAGARSAPRVGAIVGPPGARQKPSSATTATDLAPAGTGGPAPDAGRPAGVPNSGTRSGPAAPPPGRGTGSGSVGAGFRLQGIVAVDGVAVAYIEEPPARPARGYRVGDRIGDGQVDSISADTVVIRRPGGDVELKITSPIGGPVKP